MLSCTQSKATMADATSAPSMLLIQSIASASASLMPSRTQLSETRDETTERLVTAM